MNEIQKWRMSLSNSALALLFLAMAVMVVASALGLSARQPASAVEGSIFVANMWSGFTDETPAPEGFTTGPVHATFDDGVRVIPHNSDMVRITVKDAGYDVHTNVSAMSIDVGFPGSGSSEFTAVAGMQQTIFLTGQGVAGMPIAGENASLQVFSGGVDLIANGTLSIVSRFAGNAAHDPWITFQRNIGGPNPTTIDSVSYVTSLIDQVPGDISVVSDLDPAGITVQADETGLNSGVFTGWVKIVDESDVSADSIGAGIGNAGQVRSSAGTVIVSYVDSDGATQATSVTITEDELVSSQSSVGEIYIANEWSHLTNEFPAPTGYTYTGTVFATYDDGTRLIQVSADTVKVIVKDPNFDILTNVSDDSVGVGVPEGPNSFTAGPGSSSTVFLTDKAAAGELIADDGDSIQVMSGGVNLVSTGALEVVSFYAGSDENDPWVRLRNNYATVPFTIDSVDYVTSAPDQVFGSITVTSDLEPTGITIQADETGISTGVFHGFVQIVSTAQTTTGSTGPGVANRGTIRASAGPVTFEFEDGQGVTRQTTVSLDTSAPAPTATGPAPGSSTQNERPTFSGSISDTTSGLDISSITVAYDGVNDPFNVISVINTSNAVFSGTAGALPISTSGAVDGDLSFSFAQAPPLDIPNQVGTPNHIVDWVIKASDLAGNIGLSDTDPLTLGTQLPTVKIDQVIPTFSSTFSHNRTGLGWNGSNEVIDRSSIRVVFNDMVMNVQPSDFIVTLDSGATVVPVTTTVVNNPESFPNQGVVYLGFDNELVSNETPVVALQDTVQDLSGNSTATASVAVVDGIRPKITVTTSGGSGTGAGDEGPGGLTDDQMTITITSDESLNSTPSVFVFSVGAPWFEMTPTAISVGPNEWGALYDAPVGFTTGDRAVVVSGSDTSGNTETVGDDDIRTFTLDRELQEPVIDISPMDSGDVVSATPDIAVDFTVNGEISSVTILELLIDGVPVGVTPVSVEDGKKLVFQISSPLTAGQHTLTIPAGATADAAGNTNSVDIETMFEVTIPEVVTISLSPDAVSVRGDKPAVVTVSVEDLGTKVPDTVQINLQHDDSVILMESPSCAGIFDDGQASVVNRDQTDTGSWFVCTLVGGATGPSGDVATFELRRVGDGNPTVALGTTGATGSAFFEAGAIISTVSTDTLEILPGTRVQGHVAIQGVTDESAFALIGPEITLTPVSGGNPVTVQVESDGTFAFDAVLDGVYDLTLDAPGTLGRHMTGLVVGTDDVTLQTVELRGGIVNDDDDQVTGADVSVVTSNFGAGPSDLSDRSTADGDIVDFDGDGFVTGFDISIVMSNLNESRLQEWTDPAQSP